MNYFYLIIVCKQDFSVPENYDAVILHDDFKFIDDCNLEMNGKRYEFSYLIYTDKINVNYNNTNFIMCENNLPLTNWLYQTSSENIFYVTEDRFKEKVKEILES